MCLYLFIRRLRFGPEKRVVDLLALHHGRAIGMMGWLARWRRRRRRIHVVRDGVKKPLASSRGSGERNVDGSEERMYEGHIILHKVPLSPCQCDSSPVDVGRADSLKGPSTILAMEWRRG